jgi:hypothetical protein
MGVPARAMYLFDFLKQLRRGFFAVTPERPHISPAQCDLQQILVRSERCWLAS